MRKNDDGLRFLSFRVGEIKTITLVFWNYTFFSFRGIWKSKGGCESNVKPRYWYGKLLSDIYQFLPPHKGLRITNEIIYKAIYQQINF